MAMSSSRIETITPEIAREYLQYNSKNRPVHTFIVKKYVQAMVNDQWEINGESIKFSSTGRLLDGQHRLMAVMESGITIESYVVRDLQEEVFDTIDTGKTRNVSDILALEGETNTSHLGTALRMLYIHEELGSIAHLNTKMSRLITTRDMMQTFEKHPEITKSVSFILNQRGVSGKISLPIAIFCHYLFARIQPGHAESFFIQLAKGTALERGHPIFELKRRLDNITTKGNYTGRIETVALTIQAWNAWRRKESIRTLSYDRGSDFPEAE